MPLLPPWLSNNAASKEMDAFINGAFFCLQACRTAVSHEEWKGAGLVSKYVPGKRTSAWRWGKVPSIQTVVSLLDVLWGGCGGGRGALFGLRAGLGWRLGGWDKVPHVNCPLGNRIH